MAKVHVSLIVIVLLLLGGPVYASATDAPSKPAQTNLSDKSAPKKPKLITTFKQNTTPSKDQKNPVICKKRKRKNSRISREKKCMTKEQWKAQKYSATRAVSGRL